MTQEIDLEKYHQLALQKQKEHRKFLASLKKKPPKNLDKIAQQIHDEVFERLTVQPVQIAVRRWGQTLRKLILSVLPSILR